MTHASPASGRIVQRRPGPYGRFTGRAVVISATGASHIQPDQNSTFNGVCRAYPRLVSALAD